MKLDAITNKNDEWYTPREAVLPILKYLKQSSTIWCPFDTEESEYVKVLQQAGHNVIYTHIINGEDFFDYNIECDYIISNPPYSIKGGYRKIVCFKETLYDVIRMCRSIWKSS